MKEREKLKRRTVCCDGNVLHSLVHRRQCLSAKSKAHPTSCASLHPTINYVRNATKPEAFKIVSVDPTFNLGNDFRARACY